MTSVSPLRYPGGKSRFRHFIAEAIRLSGHTPDVFVEAFCGGAATAISLLENGYVNRIALNDCDTLVSSFWQVVFGKSHRDRRGINWLKKQVEEAPITLEEWRCQKAVKPRTTREAAWKCLFLNRTSFNGIIHKAGPIGGWEQTNRTLDVRFNREKLVKRIDQLYELRGCVEEVASENWRSFCLRYEEMNGVYFYLDPPYYHRAEQLYGHLFDAAKHQALRDFLNDLEAPWLLSYDDAPEVRALYANRADVQGLVIDQTYSTHPVGGASFVGREIIFSNSPLPPPDDADCPHVGMTVRGDLRLITPTADGPLRIPVGKFNLPQATAAIAQRQQL